MITLPITKVTPENKDYIEKVIAPLCPHKFEFVQFRDEEISGFLWKIWSKVNLTVYVYLNRGYFGGVTVAGNDGPPPEPKPMLTKEGYLVMGSPLRGFNKYGEVHTIQNINGKYYLGDYMGHTIYHADYQGELNFIEKAVYLMGYQLEDGQLSMHDKMDCIDLQKSFVASIGC